MNRQPVELHLVRCSPDLYSVQSIDEVLSICLNAWSPHFTRAQAEARIAKLEAMYAERGRRTVLIEKRKTFDI